MQSIPLMGSRVGPPIVHYFKIDVSEWGDFHVRGYKIIFLPTFIVEYLIVKWPTISGLCELEAFEHKGVHLPITKIIILCAHPKSRNKQFVLWVLLRNFLFFDETDCGTREFIKWTLRTKTMLALVGKLHKIHSIGYLMYVDEVYGNNRCQTTHCITNSVCQHWWRAKNFYVKRYSATSYEWGSIMFKLIFLAFWWF